MYAVYALGNLVTIGLGNGFSVQQQSQNWINGDLFSIVHLETNFNGILVKI